MTRPTAQTLLDGADLAYVSDYFSFVGADEQGHLAFALYTNRGRDHAAHQAEHLYAVLHDEREGWQPLSGTGRYPNPDGQLLVSPNSPAFTFSGDPDSSTAIVSKPNRLTLAVGPLAERLVRYDQDGLYVIRSGAATLDWRGRTARGRVIHEYLVTRGFNLISRPALTSLAGLQFLYLHADGNDDLYLQLLKAERSLAGIEPLLGFHVTNGRGSELAGLHLHTSSHDFGRGFYRWPTRWTADWQTAEGPATLRLTTRTRTPIRNWLIAAFGMTVTSGELTIATRRTPVYGFAELLPTAPRWLFRRPSKT